MADGMDNEKKTPRIFIFYYEWENTAGNHCGMVYFARCLKKYLGCKTKLIRTPRRYRRYRYGLQRLWKYLTIKYTSIGLRPDDIFFFMEYLSPPRASGDHCGIVLNIRKQGVKNKIVGLVHLPPKVLLEMYGEKYIGSAIDAVDNTVVMGSSLASYFSERGYREKVKQTFHYVDVDYYRPLPKKSSRNKFVVFILGSLYRNRNMLREIVKRCPNITFELCMGNESLHPMFSEFSNVFLNKFIPEAELLSKMQQADVSLSVFDDTLGSNTITTSLACGLPLVVSDVGSIRDYCSDENTIFCKAVDDFVDALQFLNKNRELCWRMGRNARKRAEEISLEKSIDWYRDLFTSIGKS